MDHIPGSLDEVKKQIGEKKDMCDGSELAVVLKGSGAFIGTLFGMWEGDTFSPCWNFLPEYHGMGYAYEAARAYFDFLFGTMNARRLYAYTEDNNLPSQKLCRKLGMRHEGTYMEFISFIKNEDGTPLYENTLVFAILKKEWEFQNRIIDENS